MRSDHPTPSEGDRLQLRSAPPTPDHAFAAATYQSLPARPTDRQDENRAREVLARTPERVVWDWLLGWHRDQAKMRSMGADERRQHMARSRYTKKAIERRIGFDDANGKLMPAIWRLGLGIETQRVMPAVAKKEEAERRLKEQTTRIADLLGILQAHGISVALEDGRYIDVTPEPEPEAEFSERSLFDALGEVA